MKSEVILFSLLLASNVVTWFVFVVVNSVVCGNQNYVLQNVKTVISDVINYYVASVSKYLQYGILWDRSLDTESCDWPLEMWLIMETLLLEFWTKVFEKKYWTVITHSNSALMISKCFCILIIVSCICLT